jgi:DNA-binding transcriptional MerR regulator
MTAEELCAAAGVTEDLLKDLESFGLLVPATLGGVRTYDAEGQLVARMAARYVELGVEPRHLRMYKVAAEREAGFVEQLVMPLLKQRNPTSREQAVERTDELLALGAELHASLLRRQIGPVLGT